MSTFAEMVAAVEDDLDRTDLETQVKKAINRSINFYQTQSFYFTETTGTFDTVANQVSYGTGDGIPSDLREIISVNISISSYSYKLLPVPIEWLLDQDIENCTGDPTYYAFFEQKFYLYPVPDAANTITVYYKKSYSDLSADDDTNDFTTIPEAEELIENRAGWWINSRIIKDYEEAARCKEREMEALTALRGLTNNFDGAANINTPTDF